MDHTNFSNNENVKLVQRWVDASNAHNPELIGETLHSDYEYVFSDTSFKGKENAIREWKIFFEGFPDFKYEVQQIIADGDCVVAKLRMTGTQSGPFRFEGMHSLNDPIPVSNKPIDIPTCSLFYIKDEKIILLERYWDSATLLRQIGVIDKW